MKQYFFAGGKCGGKQNGGFGLLDSEFLPESFRSQRKVSARNLCRWYFPIQISDNAGVIGIGTDEPKALAGKRIFEYFVRSEEMTVGAEWQDAELCREQTE